MSGKIGLFTGSFDPITLGHLDIITRASQLFDKLYVGLFYNKDKAGFFDLETRLVMLRDSLAGLDNVEVIAVDNRLAVAVAKDHGVTHLVRGIRNSVDLDYEDSLHFFNKELAPDLETVFFLAAADHKFLSSSRVRELIHFKADVRPYVPKPVALEVEKRYEQTQTI